MNTLQKTVWIVLQYTVEPYLKIRNRKPGRGNWFKLKYNRTELNREMGRVQKDNKNTKNLIARYINNYRSKYHIGDSIYKDEGV